MRQTTVIVCCFLHVWIAAILGGCAGSTPRPVAPPDQKVFDTVVAAFAEEERAAVYRYPIVVDANQGIVLADWHPEHKGEFEIKVEARVTGSTYEVQAWQRGPGDLFMRARETEWSRRAEDRVLKRIEARLARR